MQSIFKLWIFKKEMKIKKSLTAIISAAVLGLAVGCSSWYKNPCEIYLGNFLVYPQIAEREKSMLEPGEINRRICDCQEQAKCFRNKYEQNKILPEIETLIAVRF